MSGSRRVAAGGLVTAGLLLAVLLAGAGVGEGASAGPGDSARQETGACPDPSVAHPDFHCIRLYPTGRVLDAGGLAELRRPSGPFTLALTADGRVRYDVVLTTRDLPPPSELGPYTTYVAWAATPVLLPVERLGEVPPSGTAELGEVSFNRFLILVSAETDGRVTEPTGPFVLRGQSPSTRMQPADFLQFVLGATGFDPADSMPSSGHGMEPGGWGAVPMPEGIMALPLMMDLLPAGRPWRPGEGWSGEIVEARPRQLVELSDGDSLSLDAVYVRRVVGSRTILGYGFNGQIPGPLIRVVEDATITVRFTNRIDWPTAIHWHGVRLDNRYDGVPGVTQDPVDPGEQFTYSVRFPDPGIYWYHPHHREDVQQDLGLAGNMIVESADPDYFGPANGEEVLMLDDLLLGSEGVVPYGAERPTHALMGRFGNVLLVNGEPGYEGTARPGDVLRYLLTNVSATRVFNLSFGGAPMKVLGTDVGNFEREEHVESLLIAPAERYVVHVRFPEPGSYPLLNRVQAIDHVAGGFVPMTDTLGSVTVAGPAADPDLHAEFELARDHPSVRSEIDAYRPLFARDVEHTLELDMRARGLPLQVERLMQIDSTYFHPLEAAGTMPMMNRMTTPDEIEWILREPESGAENESIEWRFRVGDVVKIRISNRRETLHQMQHPVHIHGQRFLVLAVNGVDNENLAWKDTVVVPVGGSVDLLLELSNPGRWMLHCHIAEHLEAGMRMVFEVER